MDPSAASEISLELIGAVALVVASLGSGLVKLIWDGAQNRKIQKEMLSITKQKVKHDTLVSKLRFDREQALDSRSEAYDTYDSCIKALALLHAQLYDTTVEELELKQAIKEVEQAKEVFKSCNTTYFNTLRRINKQMMTLGDLEMEPDMVGNIS